ncbi:two-component sensor histidine kinase ChvG [Glycocaulis alkaliphilus]|uniref:histidine kinase n=1 Tax=Glycocaulis alkaliphilus TaxID=1434191 RepID=A0A3T0EDM2_9PROT|nr:stimulus-sensing domain-containing protein [Glycocaulis alkaliphilus]AZU05405.1 two-component sensor histidine kinase ChvG [Glycocaulis alkaliphilus]GGB80933.1 sensor histidine kinase [Glycocaulis alkaliphilus]
MASDTATRRREPGRLKARLAGLTSNLHQALFSRLAAGILVANLFALGLLALGTLALIENRTGLIDAKVDSLTQQADIIRNVITETAVEGSPEPALNARIAAEVLARLYVPEGTRAMIHGPEGRLAADSYLSAGRVSVELLPPPGERDIEGFFTGLWRAVRDFVGGFFLSAEERETRERSLGEEIALAQTTGEAVAGVRRGRYGERVVSVTLAIAPVQTIVGSVTYESYDYDALIAADRVAILPYLGFAALIIVAFGTLLALRIAGPVKRLSDAARSVQLAGGRRVPLPDFSRRGDEIGDLEQAFRAMTDALYDRLDAIESFAADVAHEIKNPLTSIRSAAEVLVRARDDSARERLVSVIQKDVQRLDRLITDISNASRLDAELARDQVTPVDLVRLIRDIVRVYIDGERASPGQLELQTDLAEAFIAAREEPLGRVFTNLIDNALTFSPPEGKVRISIKRKQGNTRESTRERFVILVDDDGPGIPPEALETIFNRFYTQRPAGAAFGTHSGLGLAIARQIISAHGGTIHAENRTSPASGARFVIELTSVS